MPTWEAPAKPRMPWWQSPLLTLTFRMRMRGWRAPAYMALVAGVAVALLVGAILILWPYQASPEQLPLALARLGRQLFGVVMAGEALLCSLLMLTLTAGAFAGERERGTLDFLYLTPLSSAEIIRGKLFEALAFILLLLLCAMPAVAVTLLLGGVSPLEFLIAHLLILLATALQGAMSIKVSLQTPRTTHAALWGAAYYLAWLVAVGFTPLMIGLSLHSNMIGILFGVFIVWILYIVDRINLRKPTHAGWGYAILVIAMTAISIITKLSIVVGDWISLLPFFLSVLPHPAVVISLSMVEMNLGFSESMIEVFIFALFCVVHLLAIRVYLRQANTILTVLRRDGQTDAFGNRYGL